MRTIELWLSYCWRELGVAALVLFGASCAHTHFADGELVTTGTDILPNLGSDTTADVVGSVLEAAKDIDPGEVLEAAGSGNWLELIGIAVGAAAAVIGGLAARRAWRKRHVQ